MDTIAIGERSDRRRFFGVAAARGGALSSA